MKPSPWPRKAWPAIACIMTASVVVGAIFGGVRVWESEGPHLDPKSASVTEPLSVDMTAPSGPKPPDAEPPEQAQARRRMVDEQLRVRDITDAKVLDVMGRIQRHRFVPPKYQDQAYEDHPQPIGHGQTISQPYMVALMTQLGAARPESRALDIGTGSGYQAAVLAELCKEVYSIEIVAPLAEEARNRLAALGYKNITVRRGDGYRGWPEHAPFDVILVAASPNHVPQPLVDQLAPGGRMVIPVGGYPQRLTIIERSADGSVRRRSVAPVMFVPMTGEARESGRRE